MGSIIAFILYLGVMLAVMVFLLVLAARFVRAHERGAAALERIARSVDPLTAKARVEP